jgi:hypothetical protein
MRPRGLRSPWRKATPTYWFEPDQPSRMVERSRAITEDVAASEEPRQTTGGPVTRAAEGERVRSSGSGHRPRRA